MDRRLFVSLDLPGSLSPEIAAVQEPLKDLDGVRPTFAGQAHVTLKFLGEVPHEEIDDIIDLMEQAVVKADREPFSATVGGLGVFPSFDYISVIWTGFRDGADGIIDLHDAVESTFVEAGHDPTEHDFTPHVTLARMDHPAAKEAVQDYVSEEDPTIGEMTVSEIRLKESTLHSSGAQYETVHSVRLDAGATADE